MSGRPDGNVALRLPDGVIGIDVDAYGDKLGERTLAAWEAQYGALPPTWWSTNRDDGISAIRFFRVPPGRRWISELTTTHPDGTKTKHVEIIQEHHRFAVVWPSVHPDGRVYGWLDPDGLPSADLPSPGDLTELPEAWVAALTRLGERGKPAGPPRGAAATPASAAAEDRWLDLLVPGAPCRRLAAEMANLLENLERGARHELMLTGCMRLVRLGQQGHRGATAVLEQLREAFTDSVQQEQWRDDKQEWDRALRGAIGIVKADGPPSPDAMCSCAALDFRSLLSATVGFTPGNGGISERQVLRHLLRLAEAAGALTVRCSERQIAQAVGLHQPRVHVVLGRLQELGWVERVRPPRVGEGATYRLVPRPTSVSAEESYTAGASADIDVRRSDHFVFGSRGLGAGVAETWSALPELGVRLQRGRLFALPMSRPAADPTALPRLKFVPGHGTTKTVLAARVGKSRSTVDRHLRRLVKEGLAVRDGRGTWWAHTFDADRFADELGVVDPGPELRANHRRDRLNYYGRVAAAEGAEDARFLIVDDDDLQAVVYAKTGELLAVADTPETRATMARWLPYRDDDGRSRNAPPGRVSARNS